MKLNIRIDRLVFDRAPADGLSAQQLAQAIERHLRSRIIAHGLPEQRTTHQATRCTPSPQPATAEGLADAIYRSLLS